MTPAEFISENIDKFLLGISYRNPCAKVCVYTGRGERCPIRHLCLQSTEDLIQDILYIIKENFPERLL